MNVNWQEFWETYRKTEVTSQADLFFEVGKTIDRKPISEACFKISIDLVAHDLRLNFDDKLLELCCGNGLMTLPLASCVNEIHAVDFARHLIENARRLRQAENIRYICADVATYMTDLASKRDYVPSKILLGEALGYFEPHSLGNILKSAIKLTGNKVIFLATGIPSDELKWSFYNTPERVRRYEENQQLEGNTNDGIGRWWRTAELEQVAHDCLLKVAVKQQPSELSTFRVDALFRSKT